jgi:trans-aconitate 2-methyltransferase
MRLAKAKNDASNGANRYPQSMPSWDAREYIEFADERTRPCQDLIHRIVLSPRRIVDLGCGPGNSTTALIGRWPDAEVLGLDSSPNMIAAARKLRPQCQWSEGDIATWTPVHALDLVFSDAALHWVPNHPKVFPQLLQQVAPGSTLAVQVPANFDAPAHRSMRELAYSARWQKRFPGRVREWFVQEPAFYYDLVAP